MTAQMMTWANLDLFYDKAMGKQGFTESFADFGLKIGNLSCFNDKMKICENKRSWSFFDL